MFTATMRHLTAAVLFRDAEKVSRELLRIGVVDFVKIDDLDRRSRDSLNRDEDPAAAARLKELRGRIENLSAPMAAPIDGGIPLSLDDAVPPDLEAVEKELDGIAGRLQELRNRQREVNQEILKLEDFRRHLSLYADLRRSLGDMSRSDSSFLVTLAGSLPAENRNRAEKGIAGFPAVALAFDEQSGRTPFLVIGLKRDAQELSRLLEENGWSAGELNFRSEETRNQALGDLSGRIDALRSTLDDLGLEYIRELEERGDWFRRQWAALTVAERLNAVRSNFSRTERSALFSGWVPAEEQQRVEKSIRECTGGTYYLEWHAPAEVESISEGRVATPVKLNNPGFLKPFEMLVENYAVPEYGSVDPTPIVAVAFLAMFGLMFADAGQGLMLLLIGLFGPGLLSRPSVSVRRLFTLIGYCGIAAIVSGVLFGSYFGRPWLPPLWFDYHALIAGHGSGNPAVRSVYDVLLITIWFGIAVLTTGLLLNWINLLRRGRLLDLIFDKAGLLGGWIYFCGVYTAFYFARHGYAALPDGSFLLFAFGVPAAALFFKHPLASHGGEKRLSIGTLLNYVMEWIVELLEIFSGYLANTLSFMRVAGLGIAHVSLMLAFDQIAMMTAGPDGGYSVWSILILITGNLLVLVLEGLSAGIQALRLNYYEFFSKYFTGSGKAYAPISLRSNT